MKVIRIPDHDNDEKEEKYFIFSHVQLASFVPGIAEQNHAKRLHQFQEEEWETQNQVHKVERTYDLA